MFGFQGFKRRRRTAFWLLRPQGLTVAVLEPTTDEPLLVACAEVAVDGRRPADDVAPGLLETAASVHALDLPHVAALDTHWCRLLRGDDAAHEAARDADLVVRVAGAEDLHVVVTRAAAQSAVRRFAAARLRLAALDAAPCAVLNVAIHLSRVTHQEAGTGAFDDADLDPLTAVSVAPDCEGDAGRVGRALTVPVGLALGRFDLVSHA